MPITTTPLEPAPEPALECTGPVAGVDVTDLEVSGIDQLSAGPDGTVEAPDLAEFLAGIGARLGVSARAASVRLSLAVALAAEFTTTAETLARGCIDLSKARVLADECGHAAPEHLVALQSRLLPRAPELTAPRSTLSWPSIPRLPSGEARSGDPRRRW